MIVVLVLLPCASGAFGYWLFSHSWAAAQVIGLGTFGALVVAALVSGSGKTGKADRAGAKVPAREVTQVKENKPLVWLELPWE